MVLVVLLAVFGCRNATIVDEDGDGVEAAFDCDDNDPDTLPGAPEDCSPADRNCDGDPYAGGPGTLWYEDADGDGVGTPAVAVRACVAPENYVAQTGDCDDRQATVHPGADELCNGTDDDCDDEVDEAAVDQVTLYQDGDGDGFGDDAVSVSDCPGASGWTELGGDCDDTSATIAPDQVDVCNDGVDDDCDATTDEDVVSGVPWYVDVDGDGRGDDSTVVMACVSPDPERVAAGGDCDDTDDTRFPGAAETCDPLDQDCDGQPENNAVDAGYWYVDADGDGLGDPATLVRACTEPPDVVANGDDCDDRTDTVLGPPSWAVDVDGDGFGDPDMTPILACLQPAGTVPVALALDCNDEDALVNPDQAEVCNDGVDDDCDPTTDEEDTVVWYADFDGDGYGDPDVSIRACAPDPDFVANDDDCDDQAIELNPTDTPGCIQDHCGTIDQNETWRSTVVHTVSCDVRVQGTAKPALTIHPGAVVRFASNTALLVGTGGDGRIVVEGEAGLVRFESASATPLPGDWDGLTIGSSDQGSQITGLLVEHAGRNGAGGIWIKNGSFVLSDVTSRDNANDGLHVDAGIVTVVDGTFTGNVGNGVTLDSAAELARMAEDGSAGPSFERNVVTGNEGRPITLPGSVADEIAPSNTLTGNLVDEIELTGGTLRFAGTWEDHGLPYVVRANALVDVQDGPDTELTIADGVELVFGRSAGLRVGNSEAGRLVVEGTLAGVLMTTTADVIAQSDAWDGVTIGAHDTGSDLRGLTVEYGGNNNRGNIYVVDASPNLQGVISRYSDVDGLAVTGSGMPTVINSRFVDNDENGVSLASTAGLGARFVGNTLTGNGAAPIVLSPETLGDLDASSTFAGNGLSIQVHGDTVETDATWSLLDEILTITGNVDIDGPQDPVVTIEDGVEMRFEAGTRFSAGVGDDGSLIVEGGLLGVVMDSAEANPSTGDWQGVRIGQNSVGAASSLRGLTIANAGGTGNALGAALELDAAGSCGDPEIVLENLVITDSSKYALEVGKKVNFRLDGSVMVDNRDGCVYVAPGGGCNGSVVRSFTQNSCTVPPSFQSPVFGTWPIASASHLDGTSTFPGPVIFADTKLETDARLRNLGVPYHFETTVTVGAVAGATLTVDTGNVLAFGASDGLQIGTSATAGIVFEPGAVATVLTSLVSSPLPGEWDGVKVGQHADTVDIQDVFIEFGGDNGTAALWFDRTDPTVGVVERVTVTDSSTCGVFYDPLASDLTLVDITGDVCSS